MDSEYSLHKKKKSYAAPPVFNYSLINLWTFMWIEILIETKY